MVTHPASSLAQDRESSPAETSVLTTMLRRQLVASYQDNLGRPAPESGISAARDDRNGNDANLRTVKGSTEYSLRIFLRPVFTAE